MASGSAWARGPSLSGGFRLSMCRSLSAFKDAIDGAASERALQGVVPKPLDPEETATLCEMLKNPPAGEEDFLLDQLRNRCDVRRADQRVDKDIALADVCDFYQASQ